MIPFGDEVQKASYYTKERQMFKALGPGTSRKEKGYVV